MLGIRYERTGGDMIELPPFPPDERARRKQWTNPAIFVVPT
jgi:hypothetical protein